MSIAIGIFVFFVVGAMVFIYLCANYFRAILEYYFGGE